MLNTYVALVGRFQVVRCQGNKLNKNEAQGTILAEVVPHTASGPMPPDM